MNKPSQAAAYINKKCPGFMPQIGIILGSGLAKFAEQIEEATIISYEELPGFGVCTVPGHYGQLVLGYLHGVPVACMRGRTHFYEGQSREAMLTPIRTLKLLGVETLIITNAVGSLNLDMQPGSLVLIYDHINMQFNNPLVGINDPEFGPRFPGMEDAYDPQLRIQMANTAAKLNIHIAEGVYIGVLGPNYETPAEIRAFKILGADVVGMSTVADVIVARHCGIKVVTISTVTNLAAGLALEKITHEETLHVANQAVNNLTSLICHFVEDYKCQN